MVNRLSPFVLSVPMPVLLRSSQQAHVADRALRDLQCTREHTSADSYRMCVPVCLGQCDVRYPLNRHDYAISHGHVIICGAYVAASYGPLFTGLPDKACARIA